MNRPKRGITLSPEQIKALRGEYAHTMEMALCCGAVLGGALDAIYARPKLARKFAKTRKEAEEILEKRLKDFGKKLDAAFGHP